MPDYREFKLPDVGEGLVEAEIVTWKVKRGDEVKVNDIVVEIETAKSLVELPTPYAGVVSDLLVAEGETIAVGTPFFVVDVDPDGALAPAQPPAPGAASDASAELARRGRACPAGDEPVEPGLIGGPAPGGRTSVLVGYGPREGTGKRRARKTDSAAVQAAAARSAETAQDAVQVSATPQPEPVQPPSVDGRSPGAAVGRRFDGSARRARHGAGQAAGPQARQGPRRRPVDRPGDWRRWRDHARRRRGRAAGAADQPEQRGEAAASRVLPVLRRARDPHPDQGRPEDDRAGHGEQRVHRPPRHGVPHAST